MDKFFFFLQAAKFIYARTKLGGSVTRKVYKRIKKTRGQIDGKTNTQKFVKNNKKNGEMILCKKGQ